MKKVFIISNILALLGLYIWNFVPLYKTEEIFMSDSCTYKPIKQRKGDLGSPASFLLSNNTAATAPYFMPSNFTDPDDEPGCVKWAKTMEKLNKDSSYSNCRDSYLNIKTDMVTAVCTWYEEIKIRINP